jgi:hypothetical protein
MSKYELIRRSVEILNQTESSNLTEKEKIMMAKEILRNMEKEGWIWGKEEDCVLKQLRSEKGRKELKNDWRKEK